MSSVNQSLNESLARNKIINYPKSLDSQAFRVEILPTPAQKIQKPKNDKRASNQSSPVHE